MKIIKSIALAAILLTTACAMQATLGKGSHANESQTFNPDSLKFGGKSIAGEYFKSSKSATINDPSGVNYTFINVTEYKPDNASCEIIGTIKNPVAGFSMASEIVPLYGELMLKDPIASNSSSSQRKSIKDSFNKYFN